MPRWLVVPASLFAITRAGVLLVAYVAAPLLHDQTVPPVYHLRGTENLFVDVFGSRWDTGFYVSIAEEGYKLEGVELPSVAFFPLLPLLMRGAMALGVDALVAGILISHLALLGASILFYRWAERGWGAKTAERALWYLLIFPTSLFGSAIYTESLFLLLAIGALERARGGHWLAAGVLGALSSLARLHGVVVGVMLVVAWWEERRRRPDRVPRKAVLAGLLAPGGLALFMTHLWLAFGNPLAFADAAAAWGRVPKPPLVTMREVFVTPPGGWLAALSAGAIHLDNWIDFLAVMAFLVLGCFLLAERRWSEGLYVVLGVSLSFSSGLLMSQRRYVWVLFPVFIVLARWGERPWFDRTLTAGSLLLLALFTALFANGFWVG
ncbi:MAG: mannosyltransferase family protein [Acidobacteriota bacterium]|nr:mannosyltransferase family protein [Acidobacteriota bacterium]MDH3523079.1 mannosyltransferase family protein [Acidobacteriota bacterium]